MLHDWSDEDAVRILRNVRAAMGDAKATLVIVELCLDEPHDAVNARYMADLHMMVLFNARERSKSAWQRLFAQAGFRLSGYHSTRSLHTVVEAVPTAADAGDSATAA